MEVLITTVLIILVTHLKLKEEEMVVMVEDGVGVGTQLLDEEEEAVAILYH